MVVEPNTVKSTTPSNVPVLGRPTRHTGNVSGSQRGTQDTSVQSEARAPARAYAIHARERASSPNVITAVISSMLAQKYVRKGCQCYFAYVIDSKVTDKKIESVPVVCEYPDMFPEELPGLPLIREVEFGIDLVPETTLISIAPYRITPTKLKELKAQLQELTDKGFERPSFSLWGTPVLFVKKKDGTMKICIDYR
ncbi:uncharacterized protein LOC105764748 [Gossypium raimondii]|uniref:uncharacterized protein LOC105764748 n=1 Tax=Gossypium raimondii TaxID=29730 RepID=UPI00063AAD78|nr:uncharacterized protein LOC105764748 [Gossypium raimondii]